MQCSAVMGSETALIKGECVQKLFNVNMMIPLQQCKHDDSSSAISTWSDNE
jgi:hypothetical protein